MEIRVNTIIDALEEYVETKGGILFTGNVLVNKKEILDYIKDLRTEFPTSLTEAVAIYEDRDKIKNDAEEKASNAITSAEFHAEEILSAAKIKETELLDKNEITKKARIRAEEIILSAKEEAADILDSAKFESEKMKTETFDFVEERIAKLENTFSHAKYNSEYLKDEFYKHAGSLFHILFTNIEKEHQAVLGNRNAFIEYRESLLHPDDSAERDAKDFSNQENEEDS